MINGKAEGAHEPHGEGYCACTTQRRSDCRRPADCGAERHVRRLASIRCIATADCGAQARPGHAICTRHLAYEVLILGLGGLAGTAAIVAAVIRWGGR